MHLQNYPGFILAAFLFVALCAVVFRSHRLRIELEARILRVYAMLADAQEALRRAKR